MTICDNICQPLNSRRYAVFSVSSIFSLGTERSDIAVLIGVKQPIMYIIHVRDLVIPTQDT